MLPEGGRLRWEDLIPLVSQVKDAIEAAQEEFEYKRDDDAREIWCEVYSTLSEGKPGLTGALTARAEAQVMRLACLYAVIDRSRSITADHLMAALAIWKYVEASVEFIFGDRLGDPVADQILEAVRQPPGGLTRTAISDLFGRHKNRNRIDSAIGVLMGKGLIRSEQITTGGRPTTTYHAR